MKNSTTVSGSFFLGCGTIKGEEKYYFFQSTDDGFFKRGIIPVYNAYIREEERDDGKLEIYVTLVDIHTVLF